MWKGGMVLVILREGRAEPCPYGVGMQKGDTRKQQGDIKKQKGGCKRKREKKRKTGSIGNHKRKLRFLGKA